MSSSVWAVIVADAAMCTSSAADTSGDDPGDEEAGMFFC